MTRSGPEQQAPPKPFESLPLPADVSSPTPLANLVLPDKFLLSPIEIAAWTRPATRPHTLHVNKRVFFIGLILAASGLISPPFALLGGLIYGLTLTHPFHIESKQLSKFLLQASVVGLGFGMNLHEVVHAGRSGFFYTAVSITTVMLLRMGLGYVIRVSKKSSFLIAAGTAICGGSAIAAVGPIAEANEEEMAVSLGAVFILNSIALFLFPAIGFALHMSQSQFGLWSALAIHDTSSVVGATARFGAVALSVGTTVNWHALLDRSSLIATAVMLKSKAKSSGPGSSCSSASPHCSTRSFLHSIQPSQHSAASAKSDSP